MVSIKKLSKQYKSGTGVVKALDDINLEIGKNELIAIVGPSGSGKSTLMQMIGGMDKPTSGEINVGGINIVKLSDYELSDYRNRFIGFIFQLFYLQTYLNVMDNIQIPMYFRSSDQKERENKAIELAQSVGLGDKIHSYPKELSGGQMQRVAIARALVGSPRIILADEPTANVDRENSENIMGIFKQIHAQGNTTIIIVTHDEKVAQYCNRIIRIENGKIVSDQLISK